MRVFRCRFLPAVAWLAAYRPNALKISSNVMFVGKGWWSTRTSFFIFGVCLCVYGVDQCLALCFCSFCWAWVGAAQIGLGTFRVILPGCHPRRSNSAKGFLLSSPPRPPLRAGPWAGWCSRLQRRTGRCSARRSSCEPSRDAGRDPPDGRDPLEGTTVHGGVP